MPLNSLVLLSNKAVTWWKIICPGDKHKMHELPVHQGKQQGARCKQRTKLSTCPKELHPHEQHIDME